MTKQIDTTKAEKVAGFFKTYLLPAFIAVAVAYGTFVAMDIKLNNTITSLTSLQSVVYANEQASGVEHNELLQRIASMEAQVNYIYDWVKELRSN